MATRGPSWKRRDAEGQRKHGESNCDANWIIHLTLKRQPNPFPQLLGALPNSLVTGALCASSAPPVLLAETQLTANATSETVTIIEPRDELDESDLVVEVPQLNINGVLVGKQEVPSTTGLSAALDILEANGGYTQAWASDGIETVYRSGDTYYIEFKTPLEEQLVLGTRALVVDIGEGAIYGFARW